MPKGLKLSYDTLKNWSDFLTPNSYNSTYHIVGENGKGGKVNTFILAALSPFLNELLSGVPAYVDGCLILPDFDSKDILQFLDSLSDYKEIFIMNQDLAETLGMNEIDVSYNANEELTSTTMMAKLDNIYSVDYKEIDHDIQGNLIDEKTYQTKVKKEIISSEDDSFINCISKKRPVRELSEFQKIGGAKKRAKLDNTLKSPISEEIRRERALTRIKQKIGEQKAAELFDQWNTIHQQLKTKKELHSEGNVMIKYLIDIGFSTIEIRTFLHVGNSRINKILNPTFDTELVRKPPAHAVSEKDIKRVLEYMTSLDMEDGLNLSWKQLHSEYEKQCEEIQARVLKYNTFREYVHHYFPSFKQNKTKDHHYKQSSFENKTENGVST